jgi:hypothetical protein
MCHCCALVGLDTVVNRDVFHPIRQLVPTHNGYKASSLPTTLLSWIHSSRIYDIEVEKSDR